MLGGSYNKQGVGSPNPNEEEQLNVELCGVYSPQVYHKNNTYDLLLIEDINGLVFLSL
jgi:hypothetical protein